MYKIQKSVYSIPEVAKVLGVSRTLAYDLANKGELPVLRLGKRMVIPKVALDKMLDDTVNEYGNKLEKVKEVY